MVCAQRMGRRVGSKGKKPPGVGRWTHDEHQSHAGQLSGCIQATRFSDGFGCSNYWQPKRGQR
jgi:hypothetical protein